MYKHVLKKKKKIHPGRRHQLRGYTMKYKKKSQFKLYRIQVRTLPNLHNSLQASSTSPKRKWEYTRPPSSSTALHICWKPDQPKPVLRSANSILPPPSSHCAFNPIKNIRRAFRKSQFNFCFFVYNCVSMRLRNLKFRTSGSNCTTNNLINVLFNIHSVQMR